MISYDDIRQLQQYPSNSDSQVLSLYVNVDQAKASNLNRGFETATENLLRQIAEREAGSANGRLARFEVERERTLRFLSEYTPRGKGLVIFSDSTRLLWWQRDLQVEVPNEARWSPQPWLRPLLTLMEQHDPLAVVLIYKQRARILTVDVTGVEQQIEIDSDAPAKKHQTTGTDHIWSQSQMDRDHLKHIKWHSKRVAEELATVVDRFKSSRLAIGGPVEATTMFTEELPKRLSQMIMGTLSIPVDSSPERLLGMLTSLQQESENHDDAQLVESLITSARKGDRAVVGVSETLAAANERRIHLLVVDQDFRCEGVECKECHVLLAAGAARCGYCGGEVESAPDLINRLSHRVLDQNGKIHAVSGPAAEALSSPGRIGAVLRF